MLVRRRPLAGARKAVAGGVIALVVAGCGTDTGTKDQPKTIDQEVVAQKASESLSKKVGRKPDSVTCAKDMPFKQGATIRCTLTADGVSFGLTATVAEINGQDARLTFEVDQQPLSPQSTQQPA